MTYDAAMNLRDLEYVVAVADRQHFGRAAAACNVSQPTLSGQILKLEAELGLRLFEREGRGVRVSDRAAAVVAQARATLAAAAGVIDAAQAARDPFAGPLRLGVIATVAPYLLPIALAGAIDALPLTPLHLVEDLTDRLLAAVHGGALDGAVIATDPDDDKLAEAALYDEPFFLVSARRADKRRRASIRVEEIEFRHPSVARGRPLPARPDPRPLRFGAGFGAEGGAPRRRARNQPRDTAPPRFRRTGRDSGAAARLRGLAPARRRARRIEDHRRRRLASS